MTKRAVCGAKERPRGAREGRVGPKVMAELERGAWRTLRHGGSRQLRETKHVIGRRPVMRFLEVVLAGEWMVQLIGYDYAHPVTRHGNDARVAGRRRRIRVKVVVPNLFAVVQRIARDGRAQGT